MLKFNNAWRFHPPASMDDHVVYEFSDLIGKIAAQGDLQEILEHFKQYFAGAAGTTSSWSSSASWAETDLYKYMSSAAKNAPLFIAAFYDACETLRATNADFYMPDAPMINGILAKHGVEFEVRPPNLVARDSLSTAITTPGLGWVFPRVSPDGAWIIYYISLPGDTPGVTMEVLKVPIAGGKPQLILNAAIYDTPRCAQAPATRCAIAILSNDQLIFSSFDPVLGRGRELGRFKIPDPQRNYGWALSPDGKRIAILEGSTAQIDVLSLRTGADRKIAVKGWKSLAGLDWTSDGNGLFASSLQRGCVLLRIDLNGDAHVLWEPKGMNMVWAIPSPDGRHLAMPAFAQSSNIWMLENF